jgi:hypothetical protein
MSPEAEAIQAEAIRLAREYMGDDSISTIDDCIKSPGRFESESPMTLFYHVAMMDGDGDFDDDAVTYFSPTAAEREAFGLASETLVYLRTSDQGFVSCWEG